MGTSISKVFMVIGVLLVLTGLLVMVLKNVEVSYDITHISIPHYDFKYYGPGNYTETRYERLELCRIHDVQISSNHSTEINCSDVGSLNEKLGGYIRCNFSSDVILFVHAYSLNNEPFNLKISLYGCKSKVCELIIDFAAKSKSNIGVVEGEYTIRKLVVPYSVQVEQGLKLDYSYFKLILETDKAATVKELRIFIPAICSLLRETDYPILKVDTRTEYYTITSINKIDVSGLVIGSTLSIIGLAMMIGGVYLGYQEKKG